MPHRPPARDEYFENASTISQFPHPEGDLRDHLRAHRRKVHSEDSRRFVQEATQMMQQYGVRLKALESAMHIEHKAKPKHIHQFTQEIMNIPLPERFKMPKGRRILMITSRSPLDTGE
ncbi:hypothetical protein TIFTF001_025368 [Ficus carica]|uniref:Uncharacterized protein n=1 Tax=Ficus carica TaxID=3494 RepID=A0AA88B1D0_FICCA|nr:hypothetical protein TIFTF001_025368 [Ficus carica]